eukprot:3547568-Prymnesium_polylepis.2
MDCAAPLSPLKRSVNAEESNEACAKRLRHTKTEQLTIERTTHEQLAWVPVIDGAGAITMMRVEASLGGGIFALQTGQLVRINPENRCYNLLDICINEVGMF